MCADRARAHHVQPELARERGGFDVEIEHDLQVIADEADRRDHDMPRAVAAHSRRASPMSGASQGSLPYDALLL